MYTLYRNFIKCFIENIFNQQRKWNTQSHIKRTLMIFTLMRNPRGVDYGCMEQSSWEKAVAYGAHMVGGCPGAVHSFPPSPHTPDPRSEPQSASQVHCQKALGKPECLQEVKSLKLSISKLTLQWGRCCKENKLVPRPEKHSNSIIILNNPLSFTEEPRVKWALETHMVPSIRANIDGKKRPGKGEVIFLTLTKWWKMMSKTHQWMHRFIHLSHVHPSRMALKGSKISQFPERVTAWF